MMTLISSWFEPTAPDQGYGYGHYIVLSLLLVAGTWLRFWGLGNVGLHGDEETMAMPTMAILHSGHPVLPSGMVYVRAPLQLYLMAGSAWLFGESEWAFRFPSAVVGSLAGLACFFMGRRFLAPASNLAFVATMTFLPGLIEFSQTARMYIFLIACLMVFVILLFRWERDQRLSSLILAFLVWTVALQFHNLAIFMAPLFLFPGLSRRSPRHLVHGLIAFGAAGLFFEFANHLIDSYYPQSEDRPELPELPDQMSGLQVVASSHFWIIGAAAIATILLFTAVAVRLLKYQDRNVWPPILVGSSLIAMSVLHYYVAAVLMFVGAVFWLRSRNLPKPGLYVAMALAALLAASHLAILHASGLYPGRKLFGAVIGEPSVWPVLRFLTYSPVAGGIFLLTSAVPLMRFCRGEPLPEHFLVLIMAVCAPLFLIGFFDWDIPPRYTSGHIAPFLLCAFAGFGYFWPTTTTSVAAPARATLWWTASGLALISTAMINPVAFARTIHPSYDMYPDHKGAADYVKGLHLPADAVLIAEDVLQQTYYLGSVDYYLREFDRSYGYAVIRNGTAVDQYTGVPVVGTGHELEEILDQSRGREVFVIGSGENFKGNRRLFRGRGIQEVLDSHRLKVVYSGRDGKTRIWKLVN